MTIDFLTAVGTDGKQVIRLATGMMALTRLLIEMWAEETGVAPEETLAGRQATAVLAGHESASVSVSVSAQP